MPTYILKFGFKVYCTNIGAQKINSSIFEIFKMVPTSFQIKDKLEKTQFFQKMFLLTDFNIEIMLKMLYLTLSNADMSF